MIIFSINKDIIVINWKAIIIGILLVIVFTGIFIRFSGSLSGYLEYLIASIIVGFIVGGSIINGATNGMIASLIGGIIALYINTKFLLGNIEIYGYLLVLFISIVLMVIMGLIGGLTGSLLNRFSKILTKKRGNSSSYLQCKSCGGYYVLQPGESPGDFEGCSCGGELEEIRTLSDYKKAHANKEEFSYSSEGSKLHPLLKILIVIVLGGLIFSYVLSPLLYLLVLGLEYFGPSGGYLFIVFFGPCIAGILALIIYGFKKKGHPK